MTIWWLVLGMIVVIFGLRLAGLAAGRLLRDISSVTALRYLAPAVLTALIVTSTIGNGTEIQVDARLAGLLAASGAALLRAPILVIVLTAMVVTGGLRAIMG